MTFTRGDVNNDGGINVADIVYLVKYINQIAGFNIHENEDVKNYLGNINGDTGINVADIVYLVKYINGIFTTLPYLPYPNSAPVITISGDISLNILQNGISHYIDAGATATDNEDGDLTSSIVKTGIDSVDVSVPGTYYINYNVTDSNNLPAQTKTRTVIIEPDTVAPVITIIGDNPYNLYQNSLSTYTDPGASAYDNAQGNISNKVEVSGDVVNMANLGTYYIHYNVSDDASNQAQTKTRTVNILEPSVTIIKMPVILLKWNNNNSDSSDDLEFNINLEYENGQRHSTYDDINDLLNKQNYNYPGEGSQQEPTGSVRDYYYAISHGRMLIEMTILNATSNSNIIDYDDLNSYAYSISGDYADYGDTADNYPGILHPELSNAYANAITNYDSGGGDFANDFTNVVTFIHAGYGAETGNGDYIWSHKWNFIHNGNWITYNINPFKINIGGTNKITTIGVICHETLHTFGLPDLYDTDNSSTGAGRLSIMASGSYGIGASWSPSFANTWTRNQLGNYFTPNIIEISNTSINLSLPPVHLIDKSYKIKHPTTFDYWLIEYRTAINFDRNLPIEGLVIWHISEQAGNTIEVPPHYRGESGYKVALEQRDGDFSLERGTQYNTQNHIWIEGDEFSPYTTPSTISVNGIPSGIKIHNIRKSNNNMLFDVEYLNIPDETGTEPLIVNVELMYTESNSNINLNTQKNITNTNEQFIRLFKNQNKHIFNPEKHNKDDHEDDHEDDNEDDHEDNYNNYLTNSQYTISNGYVLQMFDSYGDGWNGSLFEIIDIETNNKIVSDTLDNSNYGIKEYSFTEIPDGCYNIICTTGSYPNEISWKFLKIENDISYIIIDNGNAYYNKIFKLPEGNDISPPVLLKITTKNIENGQQVTLKFNNIIMPIANSNAIINNNECIVELNTDLNNMIKYNFNIISILVENTIGIKAFTWNIYYSGQVD